ncbi:MAG: DUF1573 domain-containing protein [Limisphaerales bacterium]
MRGPVAFLPVCLLTAALSLFGRAQSPGQSGALLFDATLKEQTVGTGVTNVLYAFAFTNTLPGEVVIHAIRTSCGCTVPRSPAMPWVVAPGGDGQFEVMLDLRGKYGVITKSVFVESSAGRQPLTIRAHAPMPSGMGTPGMTHDEERERNLRIAMADRKAIFRGDCANCHSAPAAGKTGLALYNAACGICHDSHNRASMVPDLKNLPHPTDRDHWIKWITFGRHGSLMAPFAASEGGPLTDEQIDSLAAYLTQAVSDLRKPASGTPRLSQAAPPVANR